MKRIILGSIFTLITFACQAQSKKERPVGGPCEGCEAIGEYGDQKLSSIDTLPLYSDSQPQLKITGTVFQKDGKTPASDIILYIYHTNREGIYPKKGDEEGWGKRHGFIRGWVKTDHTGKYTFYTFRPASYPDRSEPEHIHLTVKEPGKTAYYMDEFVFEDDPILTLEKRSKLPDRGGSGIVSPRFENGVWVLARNLILGLNIPEYE